MKLFWECHKTTVFIKLNSFSKQIELFFDSMSWLSYSFRWIISIKLWCIFGRGILDAILWVSIKSRSLLLRKKDWMFSHFEKSEIMTSAEYEIGGCWINQIKVQNSWAMTKADCLGFFILVNSLIVSWSINCKDSLIVFLGTILILLEDGAFKAFGDRFGV